MRTSGNSTEATPWAALPMLHSPAEGHSAAGQAAVGGYQEQGFLFQIRAPMTGGMLSDSARQLFNVKSTGRRENGDS